MPNHFHIVLRQGMRPLGWIMQPIMRRIALAVQRRYQLQGHVFERRYRSVACGDADHLRRAIVYTHLNARRAFLSDAYRWSSAALYEQSSTNDTCDVAVTFALRLFADHPDDSELQLRAAYARYVAWRIACDEAKSSGEAHSELEPICMAGNTHFMQSFCALPELNAAPTADLRDKARDLLLGISDDVAIHELRSSRLPHEKSRIRQQLIAALLQHRYPTRKIANFLRVSDSTVSRVATGMRYSIPERTLDPPAAA